jgi:hypothetical protein
MAKFDEQYDEYEQILMSFLFGLVIGGVIASAMWANKCAHYEQAIEEHNIKLNILKGE